MSQIKSFKKAISRAIELSVASVFGLILLLTAVTGGDVHATANELNNRSLTISSSANGSTDTDIGSTPENPGQGGNGEKTAETFSFILPTTGNVGSVDFLYCTTPLPGTTCTAPTGLDASHVASIQSQSGWTGGSFSFSSATANEIKIARASAGNETNTSTPVTVKFGGQSSDYITNPTSDNTTFFVRITVYSDTAFTTAVDQGTVASSTAQQVDVTAKVQETLNFSVGTFSNGSNSPNGPNAPGSSCSPLAGTGESSGLTLGDTSGGAGGVLSATQAYDAHSYFRLSTNAFNGAVVQYSGGTLQSGTNTIAAINSASNPGTSPGTLAASDVGAPQFGIGIDSSDTQGGDGYSFSQLSAATNYASGNGTITTGGTAKFAFDTTSVSTPVTIASSPSIVVCDTGSVRYLGNIAYSTTAGIYTTDISYLVVPTY